MIKYPTYDHRRGQTIYHNKEERLEVSKEARLRFENFLTTKAKEDCTEKQHEAVLAIWQKTKELIPNVSVPSARFCSSKDPDFGYNQYDEFELYWSPSGRTLLLEINKEGIVESWLFYSKHDGERTEKWCGQGPDIDQEFWDYLGKYFTIFSNGVEVSDEPLTDPKDVLG